MNRIAATCSVIVILLSCWSLLFAQGAPGASSGLESLLQRASGYIQAGNLSAAEGELRKALALAPSNVTVIATLGGVLGMERRLEESSTLFERALKLDPADQDLRRNLAANQLQLGRIPPAIQNLQAILKSDPNDRQAIMMLGLAWERARDFQRAIYALEQVPELVRQQPDSIAALVRSYYRTGQKEKARAQLNQLRDSSSDPAAVYLGGQMAVEAGDWSTADQLFTSIQATHPRPFLVDYQLARIRYETKRYGESKSLLEPIANSPESNGTVVNLLAWCYLKEGDEETAKKILSYAVDRFPEESANFVDLGKLRLKDSNFDQGLDVVRRGAERHPESAALFELKGELESKLGLHQPSVQSFKQAVRLNSRSPEALLGLALAQTNLLQNKDAVASFEKGLKLFPRDARFYAEYGKVLLLPWASGEIAGAEPKAEKLLRKAIQLDGNLASARFELGSLLVKTQRASEAAPHLERAAELDPRNAQAHFVLSRAYRALGKREEAEREMLLFQNLQGKGAVPSPGP